ncbi:MAG: tetratricopeptide repeat protein [Burkholderiales bacterium]
MDAGNLAELHALIEAATRGDAHAQTTLGLAYELGHGVGRDVLQAGHLYRQAALAGVARAQFALGLLYEFGCDREPLPDLARPWYERAARQGHDGARLRLAALAGECATTH